MMAVLPLVALSLLPVLFGLVSTVYLAANTAAWQQLLAEPGLWHSAMLSVGTGLCATLLALLLAHALLACTIGTKALNRLRAGSLPLLAMPHLALAIGVALVLAPSGLLLRLLSPWLTGFHQPPDWASIQDPHGLALILGLVIKETPFLLLALSAAMAQVPCERLLLQARSLGYGPLKSWAVAVAPLLQRQIALPFAAVLVFGVSNVDMAIALAPTTPPPLSMLLWQWFLDPDLTLRSVAAAGSVLMLGMCAALVAAIHTSGRWLWRAAQRDHGFVANGRRAANDALLRHLLRGGAAVLFALGVLAVIALALRSRGGGWRFPALLPLGVRPASLQSGNAWQATPALFGDAARTTIILAGLTVVVSVALCLHAAERVRSNSRRRWQIASLLFLPLLIPQFSFLYGLQLMLALLRIDGTLSAVLWAHLLYALPYVYGIVAPARAALDPRLNDVSRTLGAGPVRTFARVTLPLMARSTLLAAALAFSVSVAVYLPTLFAGAGRIATFATDAAATLSAGNLAAAARSAFSQSLLPLLALGAAIVLQRMLFRSRKGVPG